ncbi:MAG: class I SAM-dependent methyltransferase [Alphaproteobacteria bacterium]|nr:class I SAM-dependent methyltransferase [Alphaproteobacteria bacterium]
MQNAASFWNKAAQKYAKSEISDMDAYTYTLGRTRSYLSSNDQVLELGCGTGSTALLLAGNVGHITASDLSENMLKVGTEKAAGQEISNVTFVQSDVMGSAIGEGPYDAVMAFNLLHLLEDPKGAIQRVGGLLKPGGLFISKTVCTPGAGLPFKFWLILMVLPIMQWLGKAPYVNFMEIEELEAMIRAEGFEIMEAGNYPAAPPSRYIVAKRL